MIRINIIWTILAPLILVCSLSAEGAVYYASDCSSSAIQAAINKAADGDTVSIPSGNCTWTGSVTMPNTKGLILQGAGSSNTIITTGYTLNLQTALGRQPIRVTGMKFIHTNIKESIIITGRAKNWRIDNNIFDDAGIYGVYSIRIGDNSANSIAFTYGVIDHNQFINRNYATSIFVEWPMGNSDPIAAGDWIWSQPAERGTAQAVYIENNVFSGNATASQVVDSRWGAKYVLRYNTIHNPWIATHSGCSNHGREPIWTEVYKNVFTDDANHYGGSEIEMRTTSGIVWGNTSATTLQRYGITIDHERSYRTDCAGTFGPTCNGTASIDENSGLNGYHCLGQPGWGPPQGTNMNTYSFAGLFTWGNLNSGSAVNMGIANNLGYTSQHLVGGRDFFNSANMTIGPIANRPSTCNVSTSARDIYISTNENSQGAIIYACSATNVWTKHWEPFTYPHPLIGGGNLPFPSQPTDLR